MALRPNLQDRIVAANERYHEMIAMGVRNPHGEARVAIRATATWLDDLANLPYRRGGVKQHGVGGFISHMLLSIFARMLREELER